MIDLEKQVIVGVDVHKYGHTAVLIDSSTLPVCKYEFNNSSKSIEAFKSKVKTIASGKQVFYALEDTHGHGSILSKY